MTPDLAPWQWLLGAFSALCIGMAKTGLPGIGTMVAPLMVLTVGDARFAAAWTLPILSMGDVFAVIYWRRQAEARTLFSLIPWVAVGIAAGALALAMDEQAIRRIVGFVVIAMLVVQVYRRRRPATQVASGASFYGVAAGFATTIANAAGPVMNMYLLSRRLTKEQFVATGAWFFLVVNLSKVPIYAGYELFSRQSLTFNAWMAPAVIAGAGIGLWIIHRIPQRVFEALVITLTALSAVFLFR